MKTSEIKPNTVIQFSYKKSHPKENRVVYVTKVDSTSITGCEFSDIGNPIKKFLLTHIVNLSLISSAKLPVEADVYAYEIFSEMLGANDTDIKWEEVYGELIGYVLPGETGLRGKINEYINAIDIQNGKKEIRLYFRDGYVQDIAGNKYKTPQELAQYILTYLS